MKLIKLLISALLIATGCTYAAEKQIIPNGVAPKELDAKQQAELDSKLENALCLHDRASMLTLLSQKANPNTFHKLQNYDPKCTKQGARSLLHIAADHYPELVDLLLAFKADPNLPSSYYFADDFSYGTQWKENETPLMFVAEKVAKNNREYQDESTLEQVVQSLLNAKADPNKKGGNYTAQPLLAALRDKNKKGIALSLIRAKADCNQKPAPPYRAPLDFALMQPNNINVIIALLQAGAKNTNQTPLLYFLNPPLLCFLNPKNKPHQRPDEDACTSLASAVVKSVCKTPSNGNVFHQLRARELGKGIRSDLLVYKRSEEPTDKKDNAKKDEGKKA